MTIPIETPTNETNSEIKTHPLTAETKIENVKGYLKPHATFHAFRSSSHYLLFLLKSIFFTSSICLV